MGVKYDNWLGGYTPMCNDCGIALCWDISSEEYKENTAFWEAWICKTCNGGVPFNKTHWESLTGKM